MDGSIRMSDQNFKMIYQNLENQYPTHPQPIFFLKFLTQINNTKSSNLMSHLFCTNMLLTLPGKYHLSLFPPVTPSLFIYVFLSFHSLRDMLTTVMGPGEVAMKKTV